MRDRLDFPATIAAVKRLSEKWQTAARKLVEERANGAALIASLQHEIRGFIAVNPSDSKESRCHACTPQLEAGNVFILTRTLPVG